MSACVSTRIGTALKARAKLQEHAARIVAQPSRVNPSETAGRIIADLMELGIEVRTTARARALVQRMIARDVLLLTRHSDRRREFVNDVMRAVRD